MLHRKLEIAVAQSKGENARCVVSEKENLTCSQDRRRGVAICGVAISGWQHGNAINAAIAEQDSNPGHKTPMRTWPVRLGAILVVRTKIEGAQDRAGLTLLADPLECVEVVGRSVLERTIDRFLDAGVESISVLVGPEMYQRRTPIPIRSRNITVQVAHDLDVAITEQLARHSRTGIDHCFVNSANAYAETDLLDLFYFHREAKQPITRAYDREGLLDLWVVDCSKAQSPNLDGLLTEKELTKDETDFSNGASYFIREYVKRLSHPRDLRQLAVDILRGRCEQRPSGKEIRPGVWVGEGAEVPGRRPRHGQNHPLSIQGPDSGSRRQDAGGSAA